MKEMQINNFHHLKLKVFNKEFELRKKKNPAYSKRAFARDLGVSHSLLSLITSSKRNFSSELINNFVEQSKLTESEKKIMLYDSADSAEFEQINEELAQVIADVSYYTLLGLLDTPDFKWNNEWIALRIGTTPAKAKALMNKLRKYELVEKDENGRWRQRGKPITIGNKQSMDVGKKFNRDLLKKAVESMENDPFEKRHLSSITLIVDETHMEYAMERIQKFRRELAVELEQLCEKKEVYALAVQLFPLTKERQ